MAARLLPAAPGPGGPDRIVGFEARALGSAIRLQVRLAGAREAEAVAASMAWARVREELDAVDRALSRFRDDSELTALNRLAGTGRPVRVSRRLRAMLATVHRAGRLTGGRFDASVLADLERIGEHGARLDGDKADGGEPEDDHRPASAAREGRLVLVPAVPVDSGGIGKGLALRWAAAAAMTTLPAGSGILLEAGGDVTSAGDAPAGGWRVGIEDPVATASDAEPVAVVTVDRGSVATSSVRMRNWVAPDGRRVHHLLDPRTGEPARTGLIAVTVAAPDPAWSEVWSKALFLAGRSTIGEEARARGLAAWWVDEQGRLGMTPEARVRSAWVAEARVG